MCSGNVSGEVLGGKLAFLLFRFLCRESSLCFLHFAAFEFPRTNLSLFYFFLENSSGTSRREIPRGVLRRVSSSSSSTRRFRRRQIPATVTLSSGRSGTRVFFMPLNSITGNVSSGSFENGWFSSRLPLTSAHFASSQPVQDYQLRWSNTTMIVCLWSCSTPTPYLQQWHNAHRMLLKQCSEVAEKGTMGK
jgi:hypothetical protein